MTKAFLFDMDGVLADTESEWDKLGYDELVINHFGPVLSSKYQVKSGTSIKGIFDAFVKLGWQGPYEEWDHANFIVGDHIYQSVALTEGIDDLIKFLSKRKYQIGVVSSSPEKWVNDLTSRINSYKLIKLTLSVNNHPSLKPKPAPDPYLFAMEKLKVKPTDTIILEDSVTGVQAAKASGATVICFTKYINPQNTWQEISPDADYYVQSMDEVVALLAKLPHK